jgi:outer membrane murein-binding lipoprotein Lpp
MIEQTNHMRRTIIILLFAGIFGTPGLTQTTAQERAANLRAQLSDVQARQSELQTRLQQLEYDLKPENIERSLAGIGSTHPEELREQRRRQLEGEKTRVQAQLDQLAASRTRLEAAIAQADAEAYRQGAGIGVNTPIRAQPRARNIAASGNRARRLRRHSVKKHRRLRRSARH